MRRISLWFLMASLILLGLAIPQRVHSQAADPVRYQMAPGSEMLFGCFRNCLCPVIPSGPIRGEFLLHLTGVSPLYTHYDIDNIAWTYATGDTGTEFIAHASGKGTYDIGGEVALLQRMTLDLVIQVESSPPYRQHYDSGFVPTSTTFPAIAIDTRIEVDPCRDSVFRVVAKPAGSAAVPPWPGTRLLRSAAPNPAARDVEVLLAPRAAGHARVDIVDVRGRIVATLMNESVGTGSYALRWDGRTTGGTEAGAGIFWITARVGGDSDRRRIVRLR